MTNSSANQGNFLELVKTLALYDSVMKLHLDAIEEKQASMKRPQVSLLSNRSQNDIITSLGTFIRREIQNQIKSNAQIFSILLDETTDVSHKEQVSFVVCYVSDMEIKERFLQVCTVESTTGKELENVVISLLQENGLDLKNRGQGYDGAANMSGMYKGLQSRIRTHNEKALYVHSPWWRNCMFSAQAPQRGMQHFYNASSPCILVSV